MSGNNESLQHLRHSTAHLLAATILKLYPHAKRAIGPATEQGFYYDFDFRQEKISELDFPKIEQNMHEIAKTWERFERKEVSKDEALKTFNDNPYKKELIEEFSKEGQVLTFYQSGEYVDLCKGGHSDNPKELKYFKLLSIAGAYWRGSEKNPMLTRIYGTAFPTKQELEQHLTMLEEAKKRDHKKLGRELDLFVFSDLVGSGLPLWTPKGTVIRELLNEFVWQLRKERGYQKVEIPHITKKELYETSGHWEKFKDELFRITTREGHEFAMKPMNCPHHIQIFSRKPMSYRDMPQKYANTTMVYRDEQSGELSGLSRVRCITQDDAHVFCRKSQVKHEFGLIWDIVNNFYKVFGFDLSVRLSFHDPENFSAYLGTPELWKEAETSIREIAEERKVDFFEAKGEAAFYGPKIDFMGHDSLGREWQLATIQLDINMPERFNLFCINEEGKEERIVMIHAAIMGAIERFLSILIEHFAGHFPVWLAPVQVVVLPIADRHNESAKKVHEKLLAAGIRSELNDKSDRLQAKIREATLQRIPFMSIIGDKESSQENVLMVSVRTREGVDKGTQSVEAFIEELKNEIDKKVSSPQTRSK